MVRPGLVLMAVIAVAVGVASFGALGGGHDLFTSPGASDSRVAEIHMDRG